MSAAATEETTAAALPSNDVVRASRQVLATHARSFRWASKFLPADRRDDAAVVYALCRLIDDTADEATDRDHAAAHLDVLRRELRGGLDARPLVGAFLEVAASRDLDVRFALELIAGVESDLGEVLLMTDADLLRYGYRVAGTVGLMMCAVLGVTERDAHAHAIDLGVAMQLTNICRDVLEDAERGRVYLPAERLLAAGISQPALVDDPTDPSLRPGVATVVRDILDLADAYYASADLGMRFIPTRSRLAIVVASRLYRAIGHKLHRRGGDALAGRTWIGAPRKLLLVGASLGSFLSPTLLGLGAAPRHDGQLHAPLAGLPGVRG